MANDFLVLMRRNKYDVRGHSGKRPVYIAKKSVNTGTGAPLQVHLDQREGLKAWDPVTSRFVPNGDPKRLTINFSLDLDIELRFVAKVALAAGYFVYGDLFRRQVKHNDLRTMMNKSTVELGDEIHRIETLVDSRFSISDNIQLRTYRKMCETAAPNSIIGLVPGKTNLAVFVGLLGQYIGMVNTPANTAGFPNKGEFDWGHVIIFDRSDAPRRSSFRQCVIPFSRPEAWL